MTEVSPINTLSEFLLQAHTQYLVFDLGRGLKRINNQTFLNWETQQSSCAYPRQNHAWFCIAFWNEQLGKERYIWFVKLPVDENGLLIQASRNQFLEIIVTALGSQLQHTSNEQAQLPENPYIFKPSQQQLADCNAHIRKAIDDTSRDNRHTVAYMQAPSLHNWQLLSVQDIADFVCSANASDTCQVQTILAENLHNYPEPVLNCVFSSLESVSINEALVNVIIAYHQKPLVSEQNASQSLAKTDANYSHLKALSLRALSFDAQNSQHGRSLEYIKQLVLSSTPLDTETCVVIAGRFWQLFIEQQCNTKILLAFMHKVVDLDPSFALFHGIYADLVLVPACRESMLGLLRNKDRNGALSSAIGQLFTKI